jgi:hypothetical protein
MVTFLIDEVGLDVNKVYDGRHEPILPNQTPVCSASISPFKAAGEVVRILLERGADPYCKDCNAFEEARNDLAIDTLREWKQKTERAGPRRAKDTETKDIKLGQCTQITAS